MARKLQYEEGEELLQTATAIERVTGQRPHPTTASRWAMRGTRGCVLPTVMYGRVRMTTVRAVREWLQEQTQAADRQHAVA